MAETMIAILILGVLSAISAPLILQGDSQFRDTTNRIASIFKLSRSRAITRSNAFRIRQTGGNSGELTVEYAPQCSSPEDVWETDLSVNNEVKAEGYAEISSVEQNGASNPNWALCYDNRGRANVNLVLVLEHSEKDIEAEIEVFRGGTVEVRF